MERKTKYDYENNSIYGKRLIEKIHTKKDSYSLQNYKSLITYWGSIGYLGWELMLKNNSKTLSSLSKRKLENDILKLWKF